MTKDQLFLLPPAFRDPSQGSGPFFCVDCSTVEGMLSFFPELREQIDVHYIAFPKPRMPLVELLGDAHQNCPTLVVVGDTSHADLLTTSAATGRLFATDPLAITAYLIARYKISAVHP